MRKSVVSHLIGRCGRLLIWLAETELHFRRAPLVAVHSVFRIQASSSVGALSAIFRHFSAIFQAQGMERRPHWLEVGKFSHFDWLAHHYSPTSSDACDRLGEAAA